MATAPQTGLFKLCCGCGKWKLREEDFSPRRRRGRLSRRSHCHRCEKRARKTYYAAHREEVLAETKAAYARRKDDPGFRARNREKTARWRRENPELARRRAREDKDRWDAQNPEAVIAHNRRRRRAYAQQLRGAFVEHVDPLVVLERDDGLCGICGEDVDPLLFDVDHVLPLARGGLHCYENVQVAHPICNRQKGAQENFVRESLEG